MADAASAFVNTVEHASTVNQQWSTVNVSPTVYRFVLIHTH
jgi:hypothetical protein